MKTSHRVIAGVGLLLAMTAAAVLVQRHKVPAVAQADHGYADSASCVKCHEGEAAGYARTGMAHAFYKAAAADVGAVPANARQLFHAASGTYYELTQHDGKVFQHRWQKGFDGQPDNVEELPIDYVMGSGNHVRTYLHREQDGTLIELPVAWYAEDGGHLGMNPGFDNGHPMTRRAIAYECMFCHNAYPQIPAAAHRDLSANPVYEGAIPEGIDCQRCHGPGAAHVKVAQTAGATVQEIRAKILNPKRLSNDRQMEVCEQCHLETTSRLLPDRIRHYDKGPFGYDATEPLASFNSYYSRDPEKGRTDNFEIVNGAYRLRQSQCYLKSGGALTCETCHNPHDLHKGAEAVGYYTNVCMKCHAAALPAKIAAKQHPVGNDCVSCHMPKRRTEDVVHAVMTDHLIQRNAPQARVLLAARQEIPDTGMNAYHGVVKRYLLDHEGTGPEDALYDAAAQVIDGSNLEGGVPALTEALRGHAGSANVYVELGDARRHAGDAAGGIEAYREALKVDPLSSRAQRRLGVALGGAGQTDEALAVLRAAVEREPGNAQLRYEQALIELRLGDTGKAIADLRKAIELKPGYADAKNNLGSALAQTGDTHGAEAAFRAALVANPYDSGTRANLGRLLAGAQDWKQAAFQLQAAVKLDPANVQAHGDYAVVLLQLQRTTEAEAEARAAVTLDPDFGPAQIDLALILADKGQTRLAIPLLEKAERSASAEISGRARGLLEQLRPR